MKILYIKLKFTLSFCLIFRFNFQLLWEEQDQPAFKSFPQTLTRTELLPFIIHDKYKHPLYRDPTKLYIPYFDVISSDTNVLVEHSETSDNRPCSPSDTHTDNPYYDYDTTTKSKYTHL